MFLNWLQKLTKLAQKIISVKVLHDINFLHDNVALKITVANRLDYLVTSPLGVIFMQARDHITYVIVHTDSKATLI